METTLTSKGQITIPKAVRTAMNLRNGDKIIFEEEGDGTFTIKPKKLGVETLKGIIAHKGAPVSLEEMQNAIELNAG